MSALEVVYSHPWTTIVFIVLTWWPFCISIAAVVGMRGAAK